MNKEDFSTIIEFYKMLNKLYSKGFIRYNVYVQVIENLFDKMLYLYEMGDPLDKTY